MLASTLVWSAILAALAVLLVREELVRSWRTVVLLLLAATAVWLLSGANDRWAIVAQGLITTGVAVVYFVFNRWLWSLHAADQRFANAYWDMLHDTAALTRQGNRIQYPEFVQRFEAIVERLRRTPAPSDDWRALQSATVAHLTERLNHLRALDEPDETLPEVERSWQELRRKYAALYRTKASFWLPWP